MATSQPRGSKNEDARRTGSRASGGKAVERDEHYNLIAVLYRSLREAERSVQYCSDAEESGDSELLEFFQEVQETHKELAAQARRMLAERLDGAMRGEGEEEEEDEQED